jgi:predicted pyridoxine 5'-phosphate oxidase superfamily flavin-nucleotide-binding protein
VSRIDDKMKELLEEIPIWVLATADESGTPNAVPIRYHKILSDTRLMLIDNYMKKTLLNLKANPRVTISVWRAGDQSRKSIGYQFKGTAEVETRGVHFNEGRELVRKMNPKLIPKGVILVNVDSVYITSPGPNSGNKIE